MRATANATFRDVTVFLRWGRHFKRATSVDSSLSPMLAANVAPTNPRADKQDKVMDSLSSIMSQIDGLFLCVCVCVRVRVCVCVHVRAVSALTREHRYDTASTPYGGSHALCSPLSPGHDAGLMKSAPSVNKTTSKIFDLSSIPLDQVSAKVKECFDELDSDGQGELTHSDIKVPSARARAHTRTHVYACTHTHTCMHARTHARIHAHTHA